MRNLVIGWLCYLFLMALIPMVYAATDITTAEMIARVQVFLLLAMCVFFFRGIREVIHE